MVEESVPPGWPSEVWTRLVKRKLPVAAEVPSSKKDRRAWVSVQPEDADQFRVTYFEVERERYEEVLEAWDYDEPGMLLAREELNVAGHRELRRALMRWVVDLGVLEDPEATTVPVK